MTPIFTPIFRGLNCSRVVSLCRVKHGQLLYGSMKMGVAHRYERWWVDPIRVHRFHADYYSRQDSGCAGRTSSQEAISFSNRYTGPSWAVASKGPKINLLRTNTL